MGHTKMFAASEMVHKIETDMNSKRNRFVERFDGSKGGECKRCGFSGHKSDDTKCPAKGKICHKCGGNDHFSRRCFSKKRLHRFMDTNESSSFKKQRWSSGENDKKKER